MDHRPEPIVRFHLLIFSVQIFVSYKMADLGTIQLTKSGVTFITALVMIITLGSKISRIQWIAIIIQVALPTCKTVTSHHL